LISLQPFLELLVFLVSLQLVLGLAEELFALDLLALVLGLSEELFALELLLDSLQLVLEPFLVSLQPVLLLVLGLVLEVYHAL
jgi:hypothetical protein